MATILDTMRGLRFHFKLSQESIDNFEMYEYNYEVKRLNEYMKSK